MPSPERRAEIGEYLRERLTPIFQEAGIESFLMMGYARDADGKTTRVIIGNDGGNPAYQDGLRPAILFAQGWAGHLAAPQPPAQTE